MGDQGLDVTVYDLVRADVSPGLLIHPSPSANASTAAPPRAVGLLGRAGTILPVAWDDGRGQAAPHWRVQVEYDHLGYMTLPCNLVWHNDVAELVPNEEWGRGT